MQARSVLNQKVDFPYKEFGSLDIPEENLTGIFGCPEADRPGCADTMLAAAFAEPEGVPPLRELAAGRSNVMIVTDDVSRPTPVHAVVPHVLRELHAAGIQDSAIEFIMALGRRRMRDAHLDAGRLAGPLLTEITRYEAAEKKCSLA